MFHQHFYHQLQVHPFFDGAQGQENQSGRNDALKNLFKAL